MCEKTVGDNFGKTIGGQMAEYLKYWLSGCGFYFVCNLWLMKYLFKGDTMNSVML